MGKRFFKVGEKVMAYRQVKDGYVDQRDYPLGTPFKVLGYMTFKEDKGEVIFVLDINCKPFFVPQSALKRM